MTLPDIRAADRVAFAEDLDLAQLIELSAIDSDFFSHYFFPNTVRQPSPPMHQAMWTLLDGTDRMVNMQVYRGGAKTSLLRIYTAKRICFGIAHTILYIGKSEGHAARSISWVRRQVEHNHNYAKTFGLRPGSKWQDMECEIWHGTDEYPIWLMGMGITGSIRGINRDDFRPDLIIIDDVIDEENSATDDQREKINNLIYGAIKESLTPATEAPDAKMVMLQTPLNKLDASTQALSDPEWKSAIFSCWTPETRDLPINQQISSWPERYPSETLRAEKRSAAARNRLSIWTREKECKLISPETSAFKEQWLRFYDIEPERMQVIMVIDPVPPPSDIQVAKGLHRKDFECLAAIGRAQDKFYLLEYSLQRGHDPSWTVAEFFRMAAKWNPYRVMVESVAYQRTLSWLLRQAMQEQRHWYVIEEFDDKRRKFDKIVDGLNGPAANGRIFIRREHTEFIENFRDYPAVEHDDLMECVGLGVTALQGPAFDLNDYSDLDSQEEDIPPLVYNRGAP